MKKIKIPFSLTEYQKGGYEVEIIGDKSRQPLKARIVCTDRMNDTYPLIVLLKYNEEEYSYYYTNDGKYIIGQESYCDLVLVKQEFENGDILYSKNKNIIFILKSNCGCVIQCYCALYYDIGLIIDGSFYNKIGEIRIATEEEKQTLFDALAKEGKRWNSEKKQVEDIKSKFEFKPKDWCLMSCGGYNEWVLCQFSNIKDLGYIAIGGKYFTQCVPYNEETKHLLGTTDDCPDKYKNW